MANGDFVSQYTGDQIEQAISAYLNGNTKTTVTVNVSATTQYWKTSTGSSAKYYTEIATSGSFYVGIYPDIFIVNNSGVKIIPDVDYSAKNGTFKVYSNTMVAGTVVINGTRTTNGKLSFTVRAGSPSSYTEKYTKIVNYGDNFYTVYSGGVDELKCDSLTSRVTNNSGNVGLYLNGDGRAVIGSDVIVSGGIYYIVADELIN